MSYRDIVFVEFNDIELHLLVDDKYQWLITLKELSLAFDVGLNVIIEIQSEHDSDLIEGKHFIFDSIGSEYWNDSTKRLLWTKKGVMRLAFWLNNKRVIEAIDFFEELQFNIVKKETHERIYNEVEEALLEAIETLREKDVFNVSQLNEIINSVDNFAQKKRSLNSKDSSSNSLVDGIKKLLTLNPEQMNKMVEDFLKQAMEQRSATTQKNNK